MMLEKSNGPCPLRAARRRFGVLGWERDTAIATLAQRRLLGLRALPVPGQIEMFGCPRSPGIPAHTLHHCRVGSARRAWVTRSRQRWRSRRAISSVTPSSSTRRAIGMQ
jgi:hypothetical protein